MINTKQFKNKMGKDNLIIKLDNIHEEFFLMFHIFNKLKCSKNDST